MSFVDPFSWLGQDANHHLMSSDSQQHYLSSIGTTPPPIIKQLPMLPWQQISYNKPANYAIQGQGSGPIDGTPDYLIEIRPYDTGESIYHDNDAHDFDEIFNDEASFISGHAPILQIPIDVNNSNSNDSNVAGNGRASSISGQAVPGGSLLSLIIPAITSPATINGLVTAGQVGMQGIAAMREGKMLKEANEPDRQELYLPAGAPHRASSAGLNPQANETGDRKEKGKLRKFLACQEKGQGICCVMADYCHPWAACSSSLDDLGSNGTAGLVTDILAAVPRCTCRAGFYGDGRSNGTGCQNANECTDGNSGCQHRCTDLSPGYACSCHEGFRLAVDQLSCEDIDECSEGLNNCAQICDNYDGGYYCGCEQGFLLLPDGESCQEIDECALMKELLELPTETEVPSELYELYPACQVMDLCENTIGGYSCGCPDGFELASDGLACTNINECTLENICPLNSTCLDKDGYYECLCDEGFSPSILLTDIIGVDKFPRDITEVWLYHELHLALNKLYYNNDDLCIDVNECEVEESICAHSTGDIEPRCINRTGSYDCICENISSNDISGFLSRELEDDPHQWPIEINHRYDPVLQECLIVNECTPEFCGPNAFCDDNSLPAYCVCETGFEKQLIDERYQCLDINECDIPQKALPGQLELLPSATGDNFPGGCIFDCVNYPGGFICQCPTGFELGYEPGDCVDIDECTMGACNGTCVNYEGGYLCLCPPGFESKSYTAIGFGQSMKEELEEKSWIENYGLHLPPKDSDLMSFWLSAIKEGWCKPIDKLCDMMIEDHNNLSIKDVLCDLGQICYFRSFDVDEIKTVDELLSPIVCSCPPGFESSMPATEYPMEIQLALGIPSYLSTRIIYDYGRECVDIDECQISYNAIRWGEEVPYPCKRGRPCCVNSIGSYACESKRKGECRNGVNTYVDN